MRIQMILPAETYREGPVAHSIADQMLEMWRHQVHDILRAGLTITITLEAVVP